MLENVDITGLGILVTAVFGFVGIIIAVLSMNSRIDAQGARTDSLMREMHEEFKAVREEFKAVHDEFRAVHKRLDNGR